MLVCAEEDSERLARSQAVRRRPQGTGVAANVLLVLPLELLLRSAIAQTMILSLRRRSCALS